MRRSVLLSHLWLNNNERLSVTWLDMIWLSLNNTWKLLQGRSDLLVEHTLFVTEFSFIHSDCHLNMIRVCRGNVVTGNSFVVWWMKYFWSSAGTSVMRTIGIISSNHPVLGTQENILVTRYTTIFKLLHKATEFWPKIFDCRMWRQVLKMIYQTQQQFIVLNQRNIFSAI